MRLDNLARTGLGLVCAFLFFVFSAPAQTVVIGGKAIRGVVTNLATGQGTDKVATATATYNYANGYVASKPVDITGIMNGWVLKYNSTTQSWYAAADDTGGGGGAVSSVFGRTGTVVAASGDYNASQITNTPNTPGGNIAAVNVQNALNELDTEKLGVGAAAGGDLTGTLANLQIAANAVGTTEIADNAVTAAKIPDDAIGASEIAPGAVGSSELAQQGATTGQVLKWNGSAWAPAADTDTNTDAQNLSYTPSTGALAITGGTGATIPVMGAASAGTAGERGLVPKPLAGEQGAFLRGDGTWANPSVGGDNWGSQVASVSAPISGNGTSGSPLTVADGAIAGAKLADDAVSFSKMQNINTARLLGRSSASAGDVEELLVGSGLSLSGGTLSATGGGGSITVVNGRSAMLAVTGTPGTIIDRDRDVGGVFVNVSSGTVADGGVVIALTNGDKYFRVGVNGFVRPDWWNPAHTSGTDDQPQVQAAIDYAKTAGLGVKFASRQKFYVSTPIVINGFEYTDFDGGEATFQLNSNAVSRMFRIENNTRFCSFHDFNLIGAGTGYNSGNGVLLSVDNARYCDVWNINFSSFNSYGMQVANPVGTVGSGYFGLHASNLNFSSSAAWDAGNPNKQYCIQIRADEYSEWNGIHAKGTFALLECLGCANNQFSNIVASDLTGVANDTSYAVMKFVGDGTSGGYQNWGKNSVVNATINHCVPMAVVVRGKTDKTFNTSIFTNVQTLANTSVVDWTIQNAAVQFAACVIRAGDTGAEAMRLYTCYDASFSSCEFQNTQNLEIVGWKAWDSPRIRFDASNRVLKYNTSTSIPSPVTTPYTLVGTSSIKADENPVSVGTSLAGNGTPASPLETNLQVLSGLTGAGTSASPLGLNLQLGNQLAGAATSASPLRVVKEIHVPLAAMSGTVDWTAGLTASFLRVPEAWNGLKIKSVSTGVGTEGTSGTNAVALNVSGSGLTTTDIAATTLGTSVTATNTNPCTELKTGMKITPKITTVAGTVPKGMFVNLVLTDGTCELTDGANIVPITEYGAVKTFAAAQGYTLPSANIQDRQNNFIAAAKAAGLWSQFEGVYWFKTSAGTQNFANINLKNPGTSTNAVPSAGGNLVWTAGAGYSVTVTTSASDKVTLETPGTDAITGNTAAFYGVYLSGSTSGGRVLHSNKARLFNSSTSSFLFHRTSASFGSTQDMTGVGFRAMLVDSDKSTTATHHCTLWKDGVFFAGIDDAAAATLPSSLDVFGSTSNTASTVALVVYGNELTPTQIATLNTLITQYVAP